MNDNKGFNFLVGIGGLWLVWKLYIDGFFHAIGLLTLNYVAGTDYQITNVQNYGDLIYSTPLAAFAAFIIDLVCIFGSLLILSASGLWGVIYWLGIYLKDLFFVLNEKISSWKLEKTEKVKIEEVEIDTDTQKVLENTNVEKTIEVKILEILENLENRQKLLEEKINKVEE